MYYISVCACVQPFPPRPQKKARCFSVRLTGVLGKPDLFTRPGVLNFNQLEPLTVEPFLQFQFDFFLKFKLN